MDGRIEALMALIDDVARDGWPTSVREGISVLDGLGLSTTTHAEAPGTGGDVSGDIVELDASWSGGDAAFAVGLFPVMTIPTDRARLDEAFRDCALAFDRRWRRSPHHLDEEGRQLTWAVRDAHVTLTFVGNHPGVGVIMVYVGPAEDG